MNLRYFAVALALSISPVAADDLQSMTYLAFSFHNHQQFSANIAPEFYRLDANGRATALCNAARESSANPDSGDCVGYVLRQYQSDTVRNYAETTIWKSKLN